MRDFLISPSDMRSMLQLAYELEEPRPFSQQLTTLLVGLCEMTNAAAAVALELRYLSRLRIDARPLVEVVRPGTGQPPRRSRLVAANSAGRYKLNSLERASRAEAQFGLPSWGKEALAGDATAYGSVMYATQAVRATSKAVGVILARRPVSPKFSGRDLQVLDTTWRSHCFALRQAAIAAVSVAI